MKPAAVILAAGASSRMGSPKSLLPAPSGETFLERLFAAFSLHCQPVVVVLGHQAGAVRAALGPAAPANAVVNPDWPSGQLSSLQCGLRAVPGAPAVLFSPVDQPGIRPETVAALIQAWQELGSPAVVARYRGRRGHPVLCSPALAAALLALPPGEQARSVIHQPETLYLDLDDPAIVQDIDDPEAYRQYWQAGAP